mgnify:CR=1 FL=1
MKDIARIECALIDIKYECENRECKYCPMRTGYGECVIEALDDGGPFADQAHYECVGKTGKRLLDKVDKGNADGKHTKKILAFMRTAGFRVCGTWTSGEQCSRIKTRKERLSVNL